MRNEGRSGTGSRIALRLAGAAILVISLGLASRASAVEHLIDFWDATKGLPGNSATAVAQTPEGYLWIGTYDGLARFDGVRFVKFDPSNTKALKHRRVERLFTDSAGTLWINTHDGSLTSWRKGTFTTEWTGRERVESAVWLVSSTPGEQVFVLQSGSVLRRTIENGRVAAWENIRPPDTAFSTIFCATRSGELWIRSRDERLWRVTGDRLEAMALNPGLTGRRVRFLATDRNDRIFVGTDREMGMWNGSAFVPMTPENAGATVDVTFLHFTTDGGFWAIVNGRLKKGRDRRFTLDVEASSYLTEDILQTLVPIEDRNGGIWFAHGSRGLLYVDRDGAARRLGAASGFASERVVALFQDREDNIWVSVDRGGLARVRERRFEAVSVPGRSAEFATVSVTEDRQGSIWIGSVGAGLTRFRDGIPTSFPLKGATRPFVLSLIPDGERLWMSADREDLWLFEKGVARPASTPVHGIKALLVDRSSRLWIGLRDGLARLSLGTLETFGPREGMGITDVRSLAEDAEGTIWIGGGDGRLYRHRDGRFESVPLGWARDAYPIWSLLAERDGVLWIGTYQGGLLRLKDGHVTRYTTREGLVSDVVCQLIDDEQGNLWIGSREGILRVAKESLRAIADGGLRALSSSTFGRADGIPPLECSGFQPGVWRGRSGRLWFATTRGVVSVSPADLQENTVPPPIVIEEMWVDRIRQDVPLPPERDAPNAPQGVDPSDQDTLVTVPAGRREIEFRYTGLSLSAPEAVRFRYRLLGLGGEWVDAGERRTAQFSYVPPGAYQFQVMARNSDGVWNAQGASLSVRVLPQVWETWWFKAILVVFSLTLAAGIARHISTRALRQNLARLEQQRAVANDRTRIARDIHDDLGAGLTQISLLSELLRDDKPQEARAHVEQIGETAAELTRSMDEIVWAVNPSDDTLESLWDYITHFAQEYLATAGVAFRLEAPETIPLMTLRPEMRHNVFLAVKESLHNVVKHAAAHEVRLVLTPTPAQFEIEIQDDGRGLGASPSPDSLRASSGHGLRNIDERMLSIGARFQVSAGPNGGTRVRLTVGRH